MSVDLERQLAVYGAHLTDLAPAVVPDIESLGPAIRRRSFWQGFAIAAGAAVVVVLVVGSMVLLAPFSGEEPSSGTDPRTGSTVAETTTTVPSEATVPVPAAERWSPILATTHAKATPEAARCPPGSDPGARGAVDQDRPDPRWVGNLAAAFDRHRGRIVYVDVTGETWTFDVCNNTWHQMSPEGSLVPAEDLGQLVYDADSDVTVALGFGGVSVYDASTNTWEVRSDPPEMTGPLGAVYDPVSGLIITSAVSYGDGETWELWAYDADTDEWTLIGLVTVDRETPCCTQIDLLGYARDTDRLVLTTYIGDEEITILVDPRTGETMAIATETPIVDLGWPNTVYGPADGTVYVYDWVERSVAPTGRAMCRFDTDTMTWRCTATPPGLADPYVRFVAVVEDPINHRLFLINSDGGPAQDANQNSDDIWAIDLDTGEWVQLLAPTDQ